MLTLTQDAENQEDPSNDPLLLTGLISLEEFRQTWKLLSSHVKMEISDEAVSDLAISIDFNKDGSIDINEFMEAFRLVESTVGAVTSDLLQPQSAS